MKNKYPDLEAQTPTGSSLKYNQVESLEKEVQNLKELVDSQRIELLQLYRVLHQRDFGATDRYLTLQHTNT